MEYIEYVEIIIQNTWIGHSRSSVVGRGVVTGTLVVTEVGGTVVKRLVVPSSESVKKMMVWVNESYSLSALVITYKVICWQQLITV